jgi:cholesterol transport system auxiliary component
MKTTLILIILLFAGCTFAPKITPPITSYDFGLLQSVPATASAEKQPQVEAPSLFIETIKTPAWLDNPAIHYRLSYHDTAQSYTYANSRWVATPATLLTQRIRNHFDTHTSYPIIRPGDGTRADYTLHLNLLEFIQVFDTADSSHVVISFHASLIARHSRTQLAQRSFQLQHPAASTNAKGAVHALITTSDQLSDNLTAWIVDELKGTSKNKKE